MMLPKLTSTTFETLEMKEVPCEHCGFQNHLAVVTDSGPFYCSQLCLERASAGHPKVLPPPSTDDINEALNLREQRTGDEVI